MGPPQSDPIIEEGDRPPEESSEEEAPPLPDLGEEGEPGGEDDGASDEPGGEASSEPGEEEPSLMERLLAWAGEYRGLTWEEAWDKFTAAG